MAMNKHHLRNVRRASFHLWKNVLESGSRRASGEGRAGWEGRGTTLQPPALELLACLSQAPRAHATCGGMNP